MKKIEIKGLGGLHIEVYDIANNYTELEMIKEAEKAIRRAVINYETNSSTRLNRAASVDGIQKRPQSDR